MTRYEEDAVEALTWPGLAWLGDRHIHHCKDYDASGLNGTLLWLITASKTELSNKGQSDGDDSLCIIKEEL